ncbi:MAG: hypothetical protein Fur002_00590 [Anaerolineales bacterium]
MKKKLLLLTILFTLSACSFSLDALQPQPAAAPTSTATRELSPTPSFTATITQPSPTFTSTPTLTGYKSPTPTPLDTSTPTATNTSVFDSVTPATRTPIVPMDGFVGIKTSSIVFYRSGDCEPSSVTFTVQTANSVKAEFVVLFTRFVSRATGAQSAWTSITMKNEGLNTFSYELKPAEMKAVDSFTDPWVQFQFVATNKKSVEVGRTGIFDKQLALLACLPTETPTPTATPFKP